MHHDSKIYDNTGNRQKSEIITYNLTKGGTDDDDDDEISSLYSCARNIQVQRWPMIFYLLKNIAGINSQKIHFSNGNESRVKCRRNYLKKISITFNGRPFKIKS